jgi:hypothetical protein
MEWARGDAGQAWAGWRQRQTFEQKKGKLRDQNKWNETNKPKGKLNDENREFRQNDKDQGPERNTKWTKGMRRRAGQGDRRNRKWRRIGKMQVQNQTNRKVDRKVNREDEQSMHQKHATCSNRERAQGTKNGQQTRTMKSMKERWEWARKVKNVECEK